MWNLGKERGTLGVLILTNIRLVWYSEMNTAYNVSLPYLHVVREHRRSSFRLKIRAPVGGSLLRR